MAPSTNAAWRTVITGRQASIDAALALEDVPAAEAALIKLTRATKWWRWWLVADAALKLELETEWDSIVAAGD